MRNLDLGSHTANTLCAELFGLCPYPDPRPYTLTFPSPKPDTSRPAPSGQQPLRVAHISDTHVDLSYEAGSSWECTKPICCRPYTPADAPGNTTHPCGPYGNPHCDAPYVLEQSMVAAIEALNPAFSIYTGDVVAHDLWLVNETEVLGDFNATFGAFQNLGLVYAAVGNHDTAPVNLFPSRQIPSTHNNQWTYDALASDWLALTNDTATVQSADEYGSYSAIYPGTNLRIISYNSIFYYKDNFWMYEEPMEYDPNGQLAWLISELQTAETAGQRVWLIAHIPTGMSDTLRDYSHYLDQIVQRYEATISALFFGHTHTDLFQIAYSDYTNRNANTATAIGYITPSLTPTSGPPAFRIYDIDPVTFAVLDYTVYIANITDQSEGGTVCPPPKWEKYYSAKETYGSLLSPPITDPSAELTPSFWHNVTVLMENDPSVFDAFWARTTRGYNVTVCEGSCMSQEICHLRAADAQFNCDVPTPGAHFTKRRMKKRDGSVVEEEEAARPKCEESGVAAMMEKIVGRAV